MQGYVTDQPWHGHAHDDRLLDALQEEFALNLEQSLAYRLICRHSIGTGLSEGPLRMYIGGPAGTGKTRVVNAITAFFRARGQERRLRLASYTGFAAKNVNGMTLHSALLLHQKAGTK
ncbi:hypothetical protein CALVIDRAFT_479044, partial [Calocera viscosa TUFC12733]